ncbi:hypothetical protein [Saccharolobus islandicus]|nr:hypothetical protein [Sulfolobus islandicus]
MILFAPPSVSLSPQSDWRRAVLTSLKDISTKGYLDIRGYPSPWVKFSTP